MAQEKKPSSGFTIKEDTPLTLSIAWVLLGLIFSVGYGWRDIKAQVEASDARAQSFAEREDLKDKNINDRLDRIVEKQNKIFDLLLDIKHEGKK